MLGVERATALLVWRELVQSIPVQLSGTQSDSSVTPALAA